MFKLVNHLHSTVGYLSFERENTYLEPLSKYIKVVLTVNKF